MTASIPYHYNAIKNLLPPPYREIAPVWTERDCVQCLLFWIVHSLSQSYMSNDFAAAGIPYLRGSIVACSSQVMAIWTERDCLDNAVVSQTNNFFTTCHFPDSGGAVSTCRSKIRTIRAENHCSNIPTLMGHRSNSLPVESLVYVRHPIITSRGYVAPVW